MTSHKLDPIPGGGEAFSRQVFAPYRISPVGAHTDHQQGLCLSFTVNKGLRLRYRPLTRPLLSLVSREFAGEALLELGAAPALTGRWSDHVAGVVGELQERGSLERGLEGVIEGDLPPGGVASSAALATAVLLALLDVNAQRMSCEEMLSLLVRGEQRATGVAVGLLDPATILFGRASAMVFLDCRLGKPRVQRLPQNLPPFEIMLLDSGIRRELCSSPYNQRVRECRQAAREAGARGSPPTLREVDPEQFRRRRQSIDPVAALRAEHVFAENKRVKGALQALAASDLVAFGQLVTASGASLTRLFGCGIPETEALLDILLEQKGVLGATYAGAGFGGHVVALISPEFFAPLEQGVIEAYRERFHSAGHEARAWRLGLGDGARVS